jgi:hypothetical protein
VVARDPSDTPTEQFVPDFDDDSPDGGPQDSEVSGESSEPSGHASTGDAHGAVPTSSAGNDADSPEESEEPGDPEEYHRNRDQPGGEPQPLRNRPLGYDQHGGGSGTRVTVAVPGTSGDGVTAVGVGVSRNSTGGRPLTGWFTGWRRGALVGVLVLWTAVAGVLTGYAVVRSTAGWTATWGGNEQVAVRPPAPDISPSTPRDRVDRPQYPWPTGTASPAPSVSARTPEPTRSARPSESPTKPRATPTPGTPRPPTGSPPPTVQPTPSGTEEAVV